MSPNTQRRRITPFQFTNLPRVSQERIALSQAMSGCLPGLRWEETFRELFASTLRKYVRGKRQLTLNFQITSEDTPEPVERSFAAIEKESFIIGRNPSCEIQLNSRVVSSQHARITIDRGRFFIIDQSANGTILNGKQIKPKTPVPLNHGDTISIYPFQIVFTLGQSISTEETHIDFRVEGISESSFEDVVRRLATPTPLLVIGVEPSGRRALVEMEHDLITGLAEIIFGNEGSGGNRLLRTLSNIETGVIEFLVLRIIRAMSETMAGYSAMTLRLEQLLVQGGQSLKHPEAIAEPADPVLQLTARLTVADLLSYIRLYLPYKLLQDTADRQISQANQIDLLERWLPSVSSVKTEMVAELGEIRLTLQELSSLEPSDIILLQGVSLRYSAGELAGEVQMRLGIQGAGCFSGDIIYEASSVKVILNRFAITPRAHPQQKGVSMSSDQETSLSESAEFVQSVPVTIVVELGRRSMTIADVSRLRLGQIIDLQRIPSEPVDLTIDGRVIGKGELVDVDGDLGVRILKLMR